MKTDCKITMQKMEKKNIFSTVCKVPVANTSGKASILIQEHIFKLAWWLQYFAVSSVNRVFSQLLPHCIFWSQTKNRQRIQLFLQNTNMGKWLSKDGYAGKWELVNWTIWQINPLHWCSLQHPGCTVALTAWPKYAASNLISLALCCWEPH